MENKFNLIYEYIINDAISIYRGIFKNIVRRHMAEGVMISSLMRFDNDVLSSYVRNTIKYRLGLIDEEKMSNMEDVLYDRLYVKDFEGMNQIINEFVETVEVKPLPDKLKELMLSSYKMYMPKKYKTDELIQSFYDSMDSYLEYVQK